MRSALRTVETRCEMKIVVRPCMTSRRRLRIWSSVWVSTLASASSRTRIRGSRMMARAMAVRCFWPPERVSPRSPTMVSYFSGKTSISVRDAGDGGGAVHLFVGGVLHAEGNVFANGCAEQKGLLGDEADVAAQGFERILADGASVDQHRSGRGVEDARDEDDQGGFAGAGGADDGQAAARGNLQIDIVQDRRAVFDRRGERNWP